MTQRFREIIALVLLAVLPFHALLVTAGTMLLRGSGHAPDPVLALWKEALLGAIIAIAVCDILRDRARSWRIDALDGIVVGLIGLSVLVTAGTHGDWRLYLMGFKYDFAPLVAFVILRRVPWSDDFLRRAPGVLFAVGGIVAAYGILTFFLPQSFFSLLGYSDLHSLYLPDAPVAAFQQVSGTALRRIQGSMSGANQLGLWLLVPLGVSLAFLLRRKAGGYRVPGIGLLDIAIVLTFSRAAWIGAAVMVMAGLLVALERKIALRAIALCAVIIMLCAAVGAVLFPDLIIRGASSRGHLQKPLQAIQAMAAQPLGHGLGMAGPASNRVSDACVFLEVGSDASWAGDRQGLCVFVGDAQVQPTDRVCRCPFVTENWYLQIGVELGAIGFVLYLLLIGLLIRRLVLGVRLSLFHAFVCFMFIGISTAGLFLHAWEDSAVAYTGWILVAMTVPMITKKDTARSALRR